MKYVSFLIACVATAATLSGCSGSVSARPAHSQQTVIDGSVATSYQTLAAVLQDSTAVIVGTVTAHQTVLSSADEAGLSQIPGTLSVIQINEVVSGQAPGATFVLRQLGTPGSSADNSPVLAPGSKYLLFVRPFVFEAGKTTGQYVVTAADATYAFQADGTLRAVDPEGPLPATTTVSALTAALKG